MVWNTAQSSLYKAVKKYNGEIEAQTDDKYCETPEVSEAAEAFEAPKVSKAANQKQTQCFRKTHSASITQNPDFLIIVALIFILLRENADKGLILALAMLLFN